MMKFKMLINGLLILMICSSCAKIKPKEYKLEGNVFGTSFHITYLSENGENYAIRIDSLFKLVNASLSTYDGTSDISRINSGEENVQVDTYFKEVYHKANRIYLETDGVFDPTIGVLVNAWGFGPEKGMREIKDSKIKGLLELVGFDKVQLTECCVTKKDPKIYLDFNAIAKGYGVDVVARFLDEKKIKDYLVEIGGEVRAKGRNFSGKFWRIGIEKPNFDGSRSLQQIVSLKNEAMATSGNYRKFKIDSLTGEKYVHTIDTKTGYTAKRDLLSATVIADLDCADVDGYATAFMAMGYEETKKFIKHHKELKVFLIYLDKSGETQEFSNFTLNE